MTQASVTSNINASYLLSDDELRPVAGGEDKSHRDMTNNKATTAQKQADKVDAYIRS